MVLDILLDLCKTAFVTVLLQALEYDIGILYTLAKLVVYDRGVAGEDSFILLAAAVPMGRNLESMLLGITQLFTANAGPATEIREVDLLQREPVTLLSLHLL